MTEINPPSWFQAASHSAVSDRLTTKALLGAGLGAFYGGLATTQRGAGANMSVDVAAGSIAVEDTTAGFRGTTVCHNDATVNKSITAADPTNARIDLVVATLKNTGEYGISGGNVWALEVVTGTPSGSPAVPSITAYQQTIAQIAVAANASSITNANITDRRTRPRPWDLPWGYVLTSNPSNYSTGVNNSEVQVGISGSFTVVANRRLKLQAKGRMSGHTNAPEFATVWITDDSNTHLDTAIGTIATTTDNIPFSLLAFWTPSAGSHTVRLRAISNTGGNTFDVNDMVIYVEDVGPNGVPA